MEREWIVPPELEAGSYAHDLAVWFTQHEFTLDFGVATTVDGPVVVVARVRLPGTMTFEAIRRLNEKLTTYEARYGEIRPLEDE